MNSVIEAIEIIMLTILFRHLVAWLGDDLVLLDPGLQFHIGEQLGIQT